jgi:hypothetical protein
MVPEPISNSNLIGRQASGKSNKVADESSNHSQIPITNNVSRNVTAID